MAHKSGFSYESMEDTATIRRHVEAVLAGLESGRIALQSEDRELELTPAALLRFRIKATGRAGAGRISLRIEWRDPDATNEPGGGRANLSISTKK
jgi:amphi-Trp domain-containing protein